jgi:hypothetical protein
VVLTKRWKEVTSPNKKVATPRPKAPLLPVSYWSKFRIPVRLESLGTRRLVA